MRRRKNEPSDALALHVEVVARKARACEFCIEEPTRSWPICKFATASGTIVGQGGPIMSLWHKQMSEVTFGDIDTFCLEGNPEGIRLDYKIEVPDYLGRIFTAFANTLGGIVILGVETEGEENTPVWPPKKGMLKVRGIADQMSNIAAAVYPPVSIELSPLIDNPVAPDAKLLVVRVHASELLPHASDSGTRVYVRERDRNKFFRLAQIDRIEQMLEHRRGLANLRERYAARAFDRIDPIFDPDGRYGIFWASVIPVLPWHELSTWGECFAAMHDWSGFRGSVETVPEGAMAVSMQQLTEVVIAHSSVRLTGPRIRAVAGVEACGHIYMFHELFTDQGSGGLQLQRMARRAREVFKFAKSFFTRQGVELPGALQLSIGVHNCRNLSMARDDPDKPRGMPFRDSHFRANVRIADSALISAEFDQWQPEAFEIDLLSKLSFGFDSTLRLDGSWRLE